MATVVGSITAYSPDEDWQQYVERLQFFMEANGVTDEGKKRATFLSVVGPSTFQLLRSLIAPANPADKSLKDLIEVLSAHYNPKPSEIVERYKFHSRVRRPAESVGTFLSELRALSVYCNFGPSLNDMLRDRLVCGINDDQMQKRLLSEPKLTLEKATAIAQSMESAAMNVRQLQGAKPTQESSGVHKVGSSTPHTPTRERSAVTCYRCGKAGHLSAKCRHKGSKCHSCGKMGHLQAVCRSKPSQDSPPPTSQQQHSVRQVTEGDEPYPLFTLSSARTEPWKVVMEIDEIPLEMEVDTGASLSLVAEETYQRHWSHRELQQSQLRLCTYSGEPLEVMGSLPVVVQHGGQEVHLPLVIVKGNGPSLLGRDWLSHLKIKWDQVRQISASALESMLERKKKLFAPGLGTLKGFRAKIHVDPSAAPKFCKARPVPYAMRPKVEKELERLKSEGIIEPVKFADWAAPIVPVLKRDKETVRICGDYKLTVNAASKLEQYPIPRVEDLFSALSGGKYFTKLDMSQAYQQIELDEDSKQYVVINTHKGLFRYNRLPFGVSSAPAIFQRVMESILQGIPGVAVYLDDILVSGKNEKEHLAVVEQVLDRLEEAGLLLNRDKCEFMAKSVAYLGHIVDAQGLHPDPDKVRAINDAPRPHSVSELKSYLGLLAYYSKFLPDLATVLAPLYALLRRDTPWSWTKEREEAFLASKQLLTSAEVLVHFDPELPLLLACDASSYGIGAVLSHQLPDGSERPIAFVSRSLTEVERKYSQIEREALACVFGVTRFHKYLFAKCFTLQTDHKPLLSLFNEHRGVPSQASGRIQRWALLLAMYQYVIAFKPTERHGNADAMSRLPLSDQPSSTPSPAEIVCLVEGLHEAPVTAAQIQNWTRRDPVMSKVWQLTKQGWSETCPEDARLKPFWLKRGELALLDGCVLWGSRVIVPESGREQLLLELHAGHQGVARMKSLARSFFWWPGMDAQIEDVARDCDLCQQSRGLPPAAPLHPWSWPSTPWSRIHLDYAGPIAGQMFLVLIDAHTKWMEVFHVPAATSTETIRQLRSTFARFGLPHTVVTDNGSCFTSEEFEVFLAKNGVRHVKTAPYHPASNGQAERAVQVFKTGFKKMKRDTISDRLARFLFTYRITPHSTTGSSPAELMFGRTIRSRFDQVQPNRSARVETQQSRQKEAHDNHARRRDFEPGEQVYVRNFRPGQCWLPGSVIKSSGPVSFEVKLSNGQIVRRHQDHIRKRSQTESVESNDGNTADLTECTPSPVALEEVPTEEDTAIPAAPTAAMSSTSGDPPPGSLPQEPVNDTPGPRDTSATEPSSSPQRRYPTRLRVPPDRYLC